EVSQEKNADLVECPMENVRIKELSEFGGVFDFKYKEQIFKNIRIQQLGEYQIYNATLALFTLLNLRDRGIIKISEEEIRRGLEKTNWKGRLEIIKRNPTFLIDGAHNLQGIKTLVSSLRLFNYNKLILGLGILGDKDVEHMVEIISPL